MKVKTWRPHEPGDVLERANLEIVEIAYLHPTQSQTIYICRMLCCGTLREYTHVGINYRLRAKNVQLCMPCQRARNVEEAIRKGRERAAKGIIRSMRWSDLPSTGFVAPDWPVPPMAMEMHREGWEGW